MLLQDYVNSSMKRSGCPGFLQNITLIASCLSGHMSKDWFWGLSQTHVLQRVRGKPYENSVQSKSVQPKSVQSQGSNGQGCAGHPKKEQTIASVISHHKEGSPKVTSRIGLWWSPPVMIIVPWGKEVITNNAGFTVHINTYWNSQRNIGNKREQKT